MHIPRTIDDLQRLIDNRVQESLHLDYKSNAAFSKNYNAVKADLGKDVSALANSDGGVLIYGIREDKASSLPAGLDDGVMLSEWSRERLEDVVTTAISPQVPGVEIIPIPASEGRSYFVIAVPKSYRGPHQEVTEHRYYKRANFKNRPMEDYEIRDVFARREVSPSLVVVDVDIRKGVMLELVVQNVGNVAAEDLRFQITPPIEKLSKAKLLMEGTRFFPPGKILRYFFGSAIQEVRQHEAAKFDVEVSYRNPRVSERLVEVFHFDLSDYVWSAIVESDVGELTKVLKEAFEKLTREVGQMKSAMDCLAPISGVTGLDLSVPTLRNLQRLSRGEDLTFPRIRAASCSSWRVFAEILDIDQQTAQILFNHAHWGEGRPLEEVEGLSEDVVKRARGAFEFDDDIAAG